MAAPLHHHHHHHLYRGRDTLPTPPIHCRLALNPSARRARLPCCSSRTLAFAWCLALVCCTHHVGHFLHALGLHQYAHTGECCSERAAWCLLATGWLAPDTADTEWSSSK